MAATLAAIDPAITATEKALRADFASILLSVMDASAKALTPTVRGAAGLKAAADDDPVKIKNFKFDVTNEKAVEWAQEHAAETIDGISESTRDEIRDAVESAFEDQFDVDELADKIEEIIGDRSRAETIARTETMRASNQGQYQLWLQAEDAGLLTGDEEQEWIVTPDDRLCPICEPMDGETIPMGGRFRLNTGESVDGPPAHPNCRCTIALSV